MAHHSEDRETSPQGQSHLHQNYTNGRVNGIFQPTAIEDPNTYSSIQNLVGGVTTPRSHTAINVRKAVVTGGRGSPSVLIRYWEGSQLLFIISWKKSKWNEKAFHSPVLSIPPSTHGSWSQTWSCGEVSHVSRSHDLDFLSAGTSPDFTHLAHLCPKFNSFAMNNWKKNPYIHSRLNEQSPCKHFNRWHSPSNTSKNRKLQFIPKPNLYLWQKWSPF